MSNAYIVESGNWKMRVVVEDPDVYSYIEAATRAIEGVFGNRPLNEHCELINLYNKNGDDFFNNDDLEETPPRMFSVVTTVRNENDTTPTPAYHIYLTSLLFANAGQPKNFQLALQAEALEPEKVKRFKEMCESQKKPAVEPVKPKKKRKKKS